MRRSRRLSSSDPNGERAHRMPKQYLSWRCTFAENRHQPVSQSRHRQRGYSERRERDRSLDGFDVEMRGNDLCDGVLGSQPIGTEASCAGKRGNQRQRVARE